MHAGDAVEDLQIEAVEEEEVAAGEKPALPFPRAINPPCRPTYPLVLETAVPPPSHLAKSGHTSTRIGEDNPRARGSTMAEVTLPTTNHLSTRDEAETTKVAAAGTVVGAGTVVLRATIELVDPPRVPMAARHVGAVEASDQSPSRSILGA